MDNYEKKGKKMTGNGKRLKFEAIMETLRTSPFHLEMKKSKRGAVLVVSGIMNISEYSESMIGLVSHSGRVYVSGEYLTISVLEDRVVEIYGKIEEVSFSYGKA